MKNLLLIWILAAFTPACADRELREMRAYFQSENAKRRAAVAQLHPPDTAVLDDVQEKIASIILLAKDVENSAAAVHRSRSLFDTLCGAYGMNRDDFPDIHNGLSAAETEIQLRENGLAFADRLVMKRDSAGRFIFSAH